MPNLEIRLAQPSDIPTIIDWAKNEDFAPGSGDVQIYRNTDKQGIWVAWVDSLAVGCIAGIKYNHIYGFIGLYIVKPEYRRNGYGHKLWEKALAHLNNVQCIGLEAAPHLVDSYSEWGFKASSQTIRWQLFKIDEINHTEQLLNNHNFHVVTGNQIPLEVINKYDAMRESTARPHFLSQWLKHQSGRVMTLIDNNNLCHGFARIRPCFLTVGEGWRIGPILADSQQLAKILITNLLSQHQGIVLIDSPQNNTKAQALLFSLGFRQVSFTIRMYKGLCHHVVSTKDVYGLACLELG
ncbi:GNAT family N-acetyltransferase [Synechococcus sp. M16CYN]|uniref:GNAT family N-acetyltransferase n=1 Tax=Synechococcus sp. M16CYN TaxID=3103139 RepID=UPI003245C76A